MHPLIIGAPFGNTLWWPDTTRTRGTFTQKPNGGLLYRMWRWLSTVRYRADEGGWVGRLALPNPGLIGIPPGPRADEIISVRAREDESWEAIMEHLARRNIAGWVEMNVSCPNDRGTEYTRTIAGAKKGLALGLKLIVKLPSSSWSDWGGWATRMYQTGIRTFHCCNALPHTDGSLSGKKVKPMSLFALESLRLFWRDDVTLIGGGGVTELQDVKDYVSAGADHVSIASMLINPLNWRKVPAMRDWLAVHKNKENTCQAM